MPRNTFKAVLAALLCVLLLSALLLLAACGSYYQPGSPNGTPQATPTNKGYSIIYLIDNEMQVFLAPYIR
jgi:hypothetical protein